MKPQNPNQPANQILTTGGNNIILDDWFQKGGASEHA